jgi:two-component system, OmpR family, heavy metal sensor histidine kinase CusS
MYSNSYLSHFRSLRTRLMLWNAGAVAVTGLLILLSLRQGVRFTLISDLDEVLREDLQEIKLHFANNHAYDWSVITEELDRKAEGHDFHRWFVQFYDEQDRPTWSSRNTPDLPPLTEEQKKKGAIGIQDYRLSYSRLERPLKEGAAVCVGCSQLYVSRDMATIDRLVAFAGFVVLLASPLVGHLLTSRVIQPLSTMIRTTARLHPGEFGERLPIRGTGDELDSLAHTINGLLDRIAKYLQQEHDFLANAAHDLRTPLAAIRSSVEVALGMDRSDEEYREVLNLIIEQCSSLQMLVNQLLLLAETDADRLQTDFEPVSLDHVVAKAVEMFEGVADEHGIELKLGEMPTATVFGNRHHLRQVISNLLDNAIKFTAVGGNGESCTPGQTIHKGCVWVELVRDEEAGIVHLRVKDNGIGIAAEELPQIFDRFFRADKARARDAAAAGTGLGLSICDAIIDAHGGKVGVQSEPGRGATFIVSLPLYVSHSAGEMANGNAILDPLRME